MKTKKFYSFFTMMAACAMMFSFAACGSDDDGGNSGSGNGKDDDSNSVTTSVGTITVDNKKESISSVQLISDGSEADGRVWFLVQAGNYGINIMVDKNANGKTVDLSKFYESDLSYWQVNLAVASGYTTTTLLQGMGVDWGGLNMCYEAGSEVYFKSLGNDQYELKFNFTGKEYDSASQTFKENVKHTVVGNFKGKVYNVASYL